MVALSLVSGWCHLLRHDLGLAQARADEVHCMPVIPLTSSTGYVF